MLYSQVISINRGQPMQNSHNEDTLINYMLDTQAVDYDRLDDDMTEVILECLESYIESSIYQLIEV
jgi:hypothetical protein